MTPEPHGTICVHNLQLWKCGLCAAQLPPWPETAPREDVPTFFPSEQMLPMIQELQREVRALRRRLDKLEQEEDSC